VMMIFISAPRIMCHGRDNKVCFLRMEGRIFGDTPINLELRLSVEDSPNSGGSAIDAIRICKLAKDRKVGGPLLAISAYTMKHPPVQYPDELAREMVEQFIRGEISDQEIVRPKLGQAATAR